MRKLYAFILIGTVALLSATLYALPALAIESFGVGAIPANPRADNPRTKSIFVYSLGQGQSVNDGVKVINNSDTTKTLAVYAVDSQASSDGAFACAQQADQQKEVGNWVKLDKDQVTLAPKTSETVNFTLQVPAHSDVGEHNGCIAIQDISAGAQQNKNGVVLSFRSAIRIAVTVPGKLVANLQFVNVKTKPSNQGKLQITPAVRNLGNVSLDTDLQVKLQSMLGLSVASSGGEFPVLRQTTGQFNFELDPPFWGGFYKQTISARYVPLAQSGKASSPHSLTAHTTWLFVAPQPLAALIELVTLLLAITAITLTIWRRRHHKQLHIHAMTYTAREGDNIQTIAKKYGIKWQTLAKLNKLKPPYTLSAGETIRVPRPTKKAAPSNVHLRSKR